MSVQGLESAEAEQPPSPWLVPTLALAVTVSILSARALSVFLPVMAADLNTSVALLGQVPALMLLLAGVLALVAGPLADRYGFRLTLVVGLVTVFVSTVASGLAPTLPILLAVTLMGAVARASVLPTAQAAVVTTFADEDARRRAISWVTTGLSTASIIGIPLMTVIAGATNWRVSFFIVGGMALVAAVLLQRTLPRPASQVRKAFNIRELLDSYEPLRRHRPTLLMILSALVADAGMWCTVTYLAAFLVQQHGFGIEDVGWVFLGIGVLALGGNLIAGRVKVAPRPLLLVGRIVCALALSAAFILPVSWQVSVGLMLVAGSTFAMSDLTTTLILTAVSPAGRATTLTLRSAAVCIGGALGGVIGGVMLGLGDYAAIGLGTLVLLLVSTALVWWSEPRTLLKPAVGTA